jgi:xanthine dehydrogenase accessory factor
VLAGAISGGCLEGDVAARAAEVCAKDTAVVLRYDLREDLETIWGFGAGCDGIAHVLLEPLTHAVWLFDAVAASEARHAGTLTTIVHSAHPSYPAGSHRLLVHKRTEESGHDAFGRAVAPVLSLAERTGRVQYGSASLDGQSFEMLVEPVAAPFALHIIGAGRGAEAFAAIATTLGWQVSVIDHRPALLRDLHLPHKVARIERRPEDGLGDLPDDERTAVALLTHIFDLDAGWLRVLLPRIPAYIGVLGSRDRAVRLLERLESDGLSVTDEMRQRLFAPIGLDLGGESPEAIALAAIAEIESVLHGRPGGPLRERRSPIHARTPTPVAHHDATTVSIEQCAMPPDDLH